MLVSRRVTYPTPHPPTHLSLESQLAADGMQMRVIIYYFNELYGMRVIKAQLYLSYSLSPKILIRFK